MKRKQIFDMVLCALCAALTCILAPLSIPSYNPEVPISLATFAVLIAGGLLSPRYALLSQVLYLLLGLAGLPVFSGFLGGFGIFARPSAGYVFGYILMAWLESLIFQTWGKNRKSLAARTGVLVLGMAAGTAACYILGTIWFLIMMGTPLWTALVSCVIPFLPGDALKIVVAALLVPQISRACQLASGNRLPAEENG